MQTLSVDCRIGFSAGSSLRRLNSRLVKEEAVLQSEAISRHPCDDAQPSAASTNAFPTPFCRMSGSTSAGGTHDRLIAKHNLRYARVVHSEQEAAELGLELDHNDEHAISDAPSFALLIHGTQPIGSEASKAVSALRSQGEYGYGEQADEIRVRYSLGLI
jgi:hypothetical protein